MADHSFLWTKRHERSVAYSSIAAQSISEADYRGSDAIECVISNMSLRSKSSFDIVDETAAGD